MTSQLLVLDVCLRDAFA
ncbi:DUF645 family protein [Vibrio cholerae]